MPGVVDLHALARQAMARRGLEPDLPDEALAQAQAAQPAVEPDLPDCTTAPWCSIDNDDSRDLDQITCVGRGPDGAGELWVAVADVDAVVARGTPVDRHARQNTTSVYTAGGIFPMLPTRLSTDVTSLGPGVERVALVVALQVAQDGTITRQRLFRARVKNQVQLAYDPISAFLRGGPAPPRLASLPEVAANLTAQERITQALGRARHALGALNLDTGETQAVLEGDRVVDLRAQVRGPANELIEDAMIAANCATARFLSSRQLPAIRRVVRTPEHWDGIVAVALAHGTRLPARPDAAALAAFLDQARAQDPLRFPDLSLAVVKLLGKGIYVVERPGEETGHFGLAVRSYTHATAPNRRYADLIAHRLVKAALAGRPCPYQPQELAQLADHLTAQEDAAAKVERQLRKSAAALLIATRIGDTFPALVTGVGAAGTWVRTLGHPPVEGALISGQAGAKVGDALRVRLVATDVIRGFIDFARA